MGQNPNSNTFHDFLSTKSPSEGIAYNFTNPSRSWLQLAKTQLVKSRKLGQHLTLATKGTFFEKNDTKNFTTPYSIPFLSVLCQNKALQNFYKRGQRPIVGHIKCLD